MRDNGTIEEGADWDKLQKSLNRTLEDIFPPVYFEARVLQREEKQFIAVVVPASLERPHFAGHAFVRRGSETIRASQEQFDLLVAQRLSKVRELTKWIDTPVFVERFHRAYSGPLKPMELRRLVSCNQFWVTHEGGSGGDSLSDPLDRVNLSFHNGAPSTLKLEIMNP